MLECNSHSDVIVGTGATDATPEEKLLKVSVLRFIQQLLQCHVKAKPSKKEKISVCYSSHTTDRLPLFDVETQAVMFEDA